MADDPDPSSTPEPARAPGRLGRALVVGRIVFVVAVAAVLVRVVATEGPQIAASLRQVDGLALLLSAVALAPGMFCLWRSWQSLLVSSSSAAAPQGATSARIFFVGQLGKYIPGGIWTVAAQADLGVTSSVSRVRGTVVSAGSLAVLVVSGAATGAVLTLTRPDALRSYWWVLLVVMAGCVLLAPKVLNGLIAAALRRVSHDEPGGVRLGGAGVARSFAWCTAWWLLAGVHAWVLAESITSGTGAGSAPAPLVIGAFALAWVIGLLALFAPAGIGAREGVLVLLLGPSMGTSAVLAVAVVSRAVSVAADVAVAALTVAVVRLSRSRR